MYCSQPISGLPSADCALSSPVMSAAIVASVFRGLANVRIAEPSTSDVRIITY